ncbi:MAG: T9SS type A sorting domain-containing protein [Flavobacteriaceae bacterium]|jgi:uncharacterized repeat protein (TIGR01451 family)|nr:T9SS type A sorting domain-containing protein [Flavobacteriaceae bacterium]
MKKIILLWFLLFSFALNAQVEYELSACSDNQTATFNLTIYESDILGGQSPFLFNFSYHLSETDAFNNVNEIQDPQQFTADSGDVFVRKTSLDNNSFDISVLFLTVDSNPMAYPAELEFCDPMGLPIYSLSEAIPQITNGNPNVTVQFFEMFSDAEIAINPTEEAYVPLINPGEQVLYARVWDIYTGCFSITTVLLKTQICDINCNPPTDIEVVEMADTIAQINWSNNASIGVIYSKISIRPYGEPIDENNIIYGQYYDTYVFTGLTVGECYSVNVKTVCDIGTESEWSETYDFCVLGCDNIGYCPESLTMIAFYDENGNGVKDESEWFFNQGHFVYQINDSGNDLYGYSWNNGAFILYENNENSSYDIQYIINPQYASVYSCSTTYTDISLPDNSGNTTIYFPVTATPFTDASVNIFGSPPRPGFNYTNTVMVRNEGTQAISNYSVNFTKDPLVTILNVSEPGAVTEENGFHVNLENLLPLQTKYITVTMQVPVIPTVNLGGILTNSVSLVAENDENESNNTFSNSQVVVGSFDPNDKAESHGGRVALDTFTQDDYLFYTVRFENTGTANAEFVRITDTLSDDLDENTFEMLDASHTVNTRREGSLVTWIFPFIDLPPTSVDEQGSQGFVFFRIKPKTGYDVGDIITNTAEIYFDYNPAIITNMVETAFVETLNLSHFQKGTEIIIAPNPASELTVVYLSDITEQIDDVAVYDISGKKVLSFSHVNNSTFLINTNQLVSGFYFIEVKLLSGNKTAKKLQIK